MPFIIQSLFLFGVLLSLIGCTNNSASSLQVHLQESAGIIHGTKATPDEAIAKSTVIVRLPNGNSCTGILLNDHVVLTAGHCLRHGDTGYTAHLPEVNRGRACSIASAIEISRPPEFDKDEFLPDLGLLKLKTRLCTPGPVVLDSEIRVNDILRVAGFGKGTIVNRPDYFDMTVISSDMQTLKDLYIPAGSQDPATVEMWKEIEPYHKYYSENFIFSLANDPKKTTCHGDSGGPVFREDQGIIYLVGVVQGALPHPEKGVAACQNSYILFTTPIGPHVDWIQNTIKAWN